MKKERVDVLTVQKGLFETREKAKRAIMAGLVVDEKNGERFDKAGEKVAIETNFRLKGEVLPYVSRGGLKLEKALREFSVDVQGKTVLDIGASTGGFTDVMLQSGAKKVYALDVGTNQLAWKLRQDSRVVVMEQTNFRYAKPSDFLAGLPEFACMDVSFISLTKILPPLMDILLQDSEVIALVKPQFEAGRAYIGKNGIVRDAKVHRKVLIEMTHFAQELGFSVCNLSFSPITGGTGNVEFLLHLKKEEKKTVNISDTEIDDIVTRAHRALLIGGKKE